jgi:hypothetical protein
LSFCDKAVTATTIFFSWFMNIVSVTFVDI